MAALWKVWAFALVALWFGAGKPIGVSGVKEFQWCALVFDGVGECDSFEASQLLGMSLYTDGRPQNVFECTGRGSAEECTKSPTSEGYACHWSQVPQAHVETFGKAYCTLEVVDIAGSAFIEPLYYEYVEKTLKKNEQLFVPPLEAGKCLGLSGHSTQCEKAKECSPCRVPRDFYNINATQSDLVCLDQRLRSVERPELDWCARFKKPFVLFPGHTFNRKKFSFAATLFAVDPIAPKFKDDPSYVPVFPVPRGDGSDAEESEEDDSSEQPLNGGDAARVTSSSTQVPSSSSSSSTQVPSASSEAGMSSSSSAPKSEKKPDASANINATADPAASRAETEETDDAGALSETAAEATTPPAQAGTGWAHRALPIIACSSAVIVVLLAIPVYFSLSPLKRSQHARGGAADSAALRSSV